MKILHTADWHIGKRLLNYSLEEDFERFKDWLIQFINKNNIDLLIVAGDIFDSAYPSLGSQKQFLDLLSRLQNECHQIQVIITDGNHDSVSSMGITIEIAKHVNTQIISGVTHQLADEIIEVKDKNGAVQLVVAAVPFLRDRDLKKMVEGSTFDDRIKVIKEGVKSHYQEIGGIIKNRNYSVPALAMGHLYAHGALSDNSSEREIQMGHQAGVEGDIFPEIFEYVALGHIHSSQQVKGKVPIFYSGSPYPLSFSERNYQHGVRIIEVNDKEVTSEKVVIPPQRKLVKVSGTFEECKTKLFKLENDANQLDQLIELEVIEAKYNPTLFIDIETLIKEFSENYEQHRGIIIKHRHTFKSESKSAADLFENHIDLDDLTPLDIFKQRLEKEDKIEIDEELKDQLIQAFIEIEQNEETTN
ncbi:exonuclease SbcCD subunit D C-terminal domain-containing protein [Flammeovirga yaeyamensis]|uniref:Nuclease SbcCD subunit D n=1 Tax=Flammeovirga yaeyamensis TaxID=367791 RepID=A0AAX1N4T1_9BACT|nr:exonuclease SbcCD subunit D C-terminal domain-containing protein [Flammeovirga yaeyamensis]MBB3700182.1 exonuclease SbcD [Flammeovirga yaeyamensis]NMF37188.1 exonuclease subunit SbcD [Flammeovirga yaeyamensis]QWG00878.1 exonuclease SbcCD subunit D C-terminal domain-containing protein [Flammeovirga yaeyamensis]